MSVPAIHSDEEQTKAMLAELHAKKRAFKAHLKGVSFAPVLEEMLWQAFRAGYQHGKEQSK